MIVKQDFIQGGCRDFLLERERGEGKKIVK